MKNWKTELVLCERKQKWNQNNISGTNSFKMWNEERGRYFIHDKIREDYSGSENSNRGEKGRSQRVNKTVSLEGSPLQKVIERLFLKVKIGSQQ